MDSKTYTKDLRKTCVEAIFSEFENKGDAIRPAYADGWDEIEARRSLGHIVGYVDLDGARLKGRADHIPIMTSNGDDVFPALCATDGSKRFIDNQSINGGRLLIDRRRT